MTREVLEAIRARVKASAPNVIVAFVTPVTDMDGDNFVVIDRVTGKGPRIEPTDPVESSAFLIPEGNPDWIALTDEALTRLRPMGPADQVPAKILAS